MRTLIHWIHITSSSHQTHLLGQMRHLIDFDIAWSGHSQYYWSVDWDTIKTTPQLSYCRVHQFNVVHVPQLSLFGCMIGEESIKKRLNVTTNKSVAAMHG